MIKYIIPGIGQGCCVEQLLYLNCCERYRILYDCGSYNQNILERYIDTIDADVPTTLVISHLHFDHISGIPYLIRHFAKKSKKIERLFLPAYDKEMLILFAMSIVSNSESEMNVENNQLIDFIRSLQRFENNEYFGEVNFVAPHDSEGGNNSRGRKIKDNEVREVSSLVGGILYWAIKFWVDPGIYTLLTTNDLEILNNIKLEDLVKKEERIRIKAIYDKIVSNRQKDFNRTSMLMASYLKSDSIPTILFPPSDHFFVSFGNGFVCTGDYPFMDIKTGKEIHKHYCSECSEQLSIQKMMVPHHGGSGYCDYIPFDFIKKAYAQNGKNNRYRHPDKKVANFLENLGIEFINRQD
jgi:hypothetical protein